MRIATLALAALVLGSTISLAQAADVTVDQKNLQFNPKTVTVHAGDNIIFTNSDHLRHNIMIQSSSGDSQDKGFQDYGQSITVPFATAGDYTVLCSIHPMMKMKVTVQ